MRSDGAASCIVPSKIMPPLSVRARLGESVSIDGLPQGSILASTGDFTIGTMTAVAGSGAAMREIPAPVHRSSGAAPVTCAPIVVPAERARDVTVQIVCA